MSRCSQFYKVRMMKNTEDGDLGNASQVVDSWAQSLIILAMFHLFPAVP